MSDIKHREEWTVRSDGDIDAYLAVVGERLKKTDLVFGDVTLIAPDQLALTITEHARLAEAVESNELVDLVGPFWSTTRTQAALGVSRQALHQARRDGRVLACRGGDNQWVYPLSQFVRSGSGKVAVRPLLRPLLKALRNLDGWGVATLLLEPATELDGLTPLDWARQEKPVEPVQKLAARLAADLAPLMGSPAA
ncbi:hypothetical protein [Aeromicrobium sp. IC_218]|uniref:antitoxin Xre/MbcA/ParS-like domain-containing protein n=1 Tax=Aeromicrobium sp. IC_218 TaxID=2545468 RepID=UPI00103CF45F|nr:hypothetical protein [Aeromicrobium sp. IC_218]TCI96405.1 hypothetical protein E0W78_14830 [Aeromicrobium sp. IC_218]